MTVQEAMDVLSKLNPDADLVVLREDVDQHIWVDNIEPNIGGDTVVIYMEP